MELKRRKRKPGNIEKIVKLEIRIETVTWKNSKIEKQELVNLDKISNQGRSVKLEQRKFRN